MTFNSTLRSLTRVILSIACIGSLHRTAIAQQLIDIGAGGIVNAIDAYPCPYGNSFPGARQQMLVLASELQGAGMSAGPISSVAFENFAPSGTTLTGFTVSIGATMVSDMTTTYVGGLTPVWGAADYTDGPGWNTHPFSAAFAWDGLSNIVVETCFHNNGPPSQNAQMVQSATPFNSVISRSSFSNMVCSSNGGTHILYQQRPNMRFEWTSPNAPPIAGFGQSTTFSCNGAVQFNDASLYSPSSWHWDFGDTNTDTVQDPLHIYTVDGTYTATLIVINAFGSDTISGAPITVNVNGPHPVPASCTPASVGSVSNVGILSVNINGQVTTSGDALSEGYADRTCHPDTIMAGTPLSIVVGTGTVAPHNVRAWADWDNNGTFSANEQILNVIGTNTAIGSITVPGYAFLDAPLRLRAIAHYDPLNTVIDPCADVQYGQAEDYSIVVIPNPNPPAAAFSAMPTFSCDGAVQFTDLSLNTPTSWQWDFGDLSAPNNGQSPLYIYAASGTYAVTLIATNANGSDTALVTTITVDLGGQLIAASCMPATQNYLGGYGILGVQFAGINSSSPDAIEGYQDRSCGNTATVQEGGTYPITILTGTQNAADTRVWIDMNNDGAFTTAELVFSGMNQISPSGTASIPSGVVFDTPVRLRVQTDVVGASINACDPPASGQVEDFSAIITHNTNPPNPFFTGTPTTTCDGIVQFTDASTNLPTSWLWDFGDTQTSTAQSPSHTYAASNTYTVSLTATNAFGSNTHTATNYIHVLGPGLCDTLTVNGNNDQTFNTCHGVLADDGGPNGNYSPGQSGATTIAPTGALSVTLIFSLFEWGNNQNRFLAIYDGPDVNATLIGHFTGNGLGSLPNNGVITSTGSSITLRQESNGFGGPPNSAGFLLNWDCAMLGIAEHGPNAISNIWPQPASDQFTVAFGSAAGKGWSVSVVDALGKTVHKEAIGIGERQRIFDATTWAPGCYLLSVETPEGRWSRTIAIR